MRIIEPKLTVGQILLDRYVIGAEIGQGGMQQVYLARDNGLARNVALKVPMGQSAKKRFEKSAKLSAAISHPNIAKTLDYGIDGQIEFLTEEYVAGLDLQARIDGKYGPLDPHLVAHVVHHLSKAVAAMNRLGIIHRDLKPSNIMASDAIGITAIKVTDFGVATMAAVEIENAVKGGAPTIAASRTVVGALAFMAPELIRRRDGTDRSKCDVWSIGALLYYLLFHEYPFGEGLEAIQNILNGTIPDRSSAVTRTKIQYRGLVSALWGIIQKCLVVSVADRPSAEDISNLLSQVPYSTEPRAEGRIRYVNPSAGQWGFIEPSDGSEDVFFHFESVFEGKPSLGSSVSFASFAGSPRARAFPVVLLG